MFIHMKSFVLQSAATSKMADVEFEPLHGEIEDEEEDEFILGGRKKDTPGYLS